MATVHTDPRCSCCWSPSVRPQEGSVFHDTSFASADGGALTGENGVGIRSFRADAYDEKLRFGDDVPIPSVCLKAISVNLPYRSKPILLQVLSENFTALDLAAWPFPCVSNNDGLPLARALRPSHVLFYSGKDRNQALTR